MFITEDLNYLVSYSNIDFTFRKYSFPGLVKDTAEITLSAAATTLSFKIGIIYTTVNLNQYIYQVSDFTNLYSISYSENCK